MELPDKQRPDKQQLERQLELAKWLAMLTMAVDHAGILFPDMVDYHLFRAIGRLCWPLIAWIMAVRLWLAPARTAGYLKRLLPWAIITQPVFWFTFEGPQHIPFFGGMLNIFFTLLLGLGCFWLMERFTADRRTAPRLLYILGGVVLVGLSLWPAPVDYKYMAVLSIPLLVLAARRSLPASALAAGVLGSLTNLTGFPTNDAVLRDIVIYTPLLAGFIAYGCLKSNLALPRLPRWFFYFYYPAHLIVLLILRVAVFPPAPTP